MAQLNITLNQEEILQLLSEDRNEAFKNLLTNSLNSVLKAESQEQLKASPYERTEERTDSRNGFRERELKTRIGTITLQVPRHRNQPFKTMIFDNYCRSEGALIATMAEMVVNGVSTRKVSKIMETLCGTSYSKSTVSELCRELDQAVEQFRSRQLNGGYPFLTLDATYFKVRENHRVISKALFLAYGTNRNGYREILGFEVYPKESAQNWRDFLISLKNRGLGGLFTITSDAHEGLVQAIQTVYPDVPWQRCQFHFSRNISDKAPKKYQAGLRTELTEMFNARDIDQARRIRDTIIADYKDVAPSAVECLDNGFESCMTAMVLPQHLYIKYRTSNHIERLNRELKRRSDVIGVFPNESSLLRLIGSVLIEQNEICQEGRRVFSEETYQKILHSEAPETLKLYASDQRKQLVA